MKTRMVSSATSFQRLQTSLQSPMPRLPRSNVYSTRDPANPSASVHRKRFFTPSLTLKFLCAGYLNPGEKKKNYYLSERRFGSFERSFAIPESVDESKIEANFKKGVLTVTLPKKAEVQTPAKKIEVKAA